MIYLISIIWCCNKLTERLLKLSPVMIKIIDVVSKVVPFSSKNFDVCIKGGQTSQS